MSCLKTVVLLCGIIFSAMSVAGDGHDAGPSSGAKDMPGAKGVFAFKPSDWTEGEKTWWKDSDGVAPGVAGCHIGTDEEGTPNGRMFGEACMDNGLLVESNPGKGVVHSHTNDTGHPDKFDCNVWCVATGNSSGMCTIAAAAPCEQSAKCVCK
ncbi:hypothetical protein [Shewanella sp. KX20019]|uniref:hypothetical protein n=1 Tax=Shewanella sp. KX20019 TaxID=2803864 RepID=UPI001F24D562|nr:hypothetical protein [Shewanella sp. KX20019]